MIQLRFYLKSKKYYLLFKGSLILRNVITLTINLEFKMCILTNYQHGRTLSAIKTARNDP